VRGDERMTTWKRMGGAVRGAPTYLYIDFSILAFEMALFLGF